MLDIVSCNKQCLYVYKFFYSYKYSKKSDICTWLNDTSNSFFCVSLSSACGGTGSSSQLLTHVPFFSLSLLLTAAYSIDMAPCSGFCNKCVCVQKNINQPTTELGKVWSIARHYLPCKHEPSVPAEKCLPEQISVHDTWVHGIRSHRQIGTLEELRQRYREHGLRQFALSVRYLCVKLVSSERKEI